MPYKIGIDVGGTNTDAVILDEYNNLLGAVKTPTTKDVSSGIYASVDEVLSQASVQPSEVKYVMVGTTACTNALLERKGLAKIAMVRIARPAGSGIEPMFTWAPALKKAVGNLWFELQGGFDYNGEPIDKGLDSGEVAELIRRLRAEDVEAVAITGIFSPVRPDHELELGERLRDALGPHVAIALSYETGSVGLLERENATGLNAALMNVARQTTEGLERALSDRGIAARIFFAQNDGTLMHLSYVRRFPILTIRSGATNSIRGAAYLSGLLDCVVVDVGGTSTDVGALVRGFPRQSAGAVEIGGVLTNFRMPDILTIGLGGGSVIHTGPAGVTIGPDSVGFRLTEKALAWGGDTLTATDIALAAGTLPYGETLATEQVRCVDPGVVTDVLDQISQMVEWAVDRIKTSYHPVPVVLVGGGSILVPQKLSVASDVIRPKNYQYANAIGTAIAQVSGQVDRLWCKDQSTLGEASHRVREEAINAATEAGADPSTVAIVDYEEIPLSYLPSGATRIRAKAAGAVR